MKTDSEQINTTLKPIKLPDPIRVIRMLLRFLNTKRSPYVVGNCYLYRNEFEYKMLQIGYQYNYLSYPEKGRISNLRKRYTENDTMRQIHLRLFYDGEVRMHDETATEQGLIEHTEGVSLRYPAENEVTSVLNALKTSIFQART